MTSKQLLLANKCYQIYVAFDTYDDAWDKKHHLSIDMSFFSEAILNYDSVAV
jgi:hypothetical protein